MIDEEFSTLPEKYRNIVPTSTTILHTEPSPGCASGTKGRVAVTEALKIDDKIEKIILEGGSEQDIYHVARKNGFISLKEDAIIKALNHEIPFEEVSVFGTKLGEENIFDEKSEILEDVDNPENEESSVV